MSSPAPSFPRTRAEAVAMRAWYRCRWRELHDAADLAARRAEIARGELLIVEALVRGEFDDAGTYAVGSNGAWNVAAGARGIGNGWAT